MSRTVIGLFKTHEEAQNVKHDLVNDGYDAQNIQIVGKDGAPQLPGAASTTTTDTGFAATISNFFQSFSGADPEDRDHYTEGVNTGGSFLAVTVPDNRADAAAAILQRYGAKDVNEQKGTAQATGTTKAAGMATGGQKLEVVEEELKVGKRQVDRGGVRVYSHVTERPVEEQVTLREEHVNVERHAVNRAATEADFAAFKEGTIEMTESAEEAVVSKTARVVEEVVIGKGVSERQETIKNTVRRTDVKVEKIPASQSGKMTSFSDYEPGFREHFTANYGKSGSSYNTYAPAYQYGHKLASDSRYAKSDWSTVESAARNDWAKQGSGTWEDMKAAVRQGWDKVRASSSGA